jgi:hypothetical protein
VFGRNKTSEQPAEETTEVVRDSGKGRPTPTRKEAEARRRHPIGSPTRAAATRPGASKEEKKAAKEAQRKAWAAERAKQREARGTGDERYLPARDKGAARRYARDYVDARRNAGEFFIPLALVILAASLVRQLAFASLVALYTLVLVVIVDSILLRRKLGRLTLDKYGDKASGAGGYGMMRALQLRRTRLPRPMVKRGEFPT